MLDSEVTFAGAWVPQGTYISQIVAVACAHIWAPGQVLGIRAQLQGSGLCLHPHTTPPHPTPLPLYPWCIGGGGGGAEAHFWPEGCRHISLGRAELHLSAEWQGWLYSLFIWMRQQEWCYCGALAPRTVILRGVLLLIFVDRLKCHGLCAKPIGDHASLNWSRRGSTMGKYRWETIIMNT